MTKLKALHRRWSKEGGYKSAYKALGEEFELATAPHRFAHRMRLEEFAAWAADDRTALLDSNRCLPGHDRARRRSSISA